MQNKYICIYIISTVEFISYRLGQNVFIGVHWPALGKIVSAI